MATSRSGIYNQLNGKVGNMVCYMLRGQAVTRSIGRPGKPSPLQLANYQAMKVMMAVLRKMVPFVNMGYEHEAIGTTRNPYNLATSYNKKHALKGVYPNLKVDYSQLKLSEGKINMPEETTLVKTAAGIEITWNGFQDVTRRHDDLAMVMLYHPSATKKHTTNAFYAAHRKTGKCFISLTEEQLTEPIEAYMCFKSNDAKSVSDSVYLGNLNGETEGEEQVVIQEEYTRVKARYDTVKAKYDALEEDPNGPHYLDKSMKSMRRECDVLFSQLARLRERRPQQ